MKISPYHVKCVLCREPVFIPRGEHVSVLENGRQKTYHNEPRTIRGSRQCWTQYKEGYAVLF